MTAFWPLNYPCPVCPAKERQWCAPNWPASECGLIGFTHEQRTLYNIPPADGAEPDKATFDRAVRGLDEV
jgi:hypothetical protein